MNLAKQSIWSGQRASILLILVCFAFSSTGCGSSHEQRQAKERADSRDIIRKKDARVEIVSAQMSEKHNALIFPPDDLPPSAFTYELQRFFSVNEGKTVLFKGYLEDIEQTGRDVDVEFLCPLAENLYLDGTAIRFRLAVADENVKPFLAAKRGKPEFRSLRYLHKPNWIIVAKIVELKRSRRYEYHGHARGDEVEIDIETPPSFVSIGILIDARQMSDD
jgi:hypothetical protein